MTVAELIRELSEMPNQNAKVTFPDFMQRGVFKTPTKNQVCEVYGAILIDENEVFLTDKWEE